MSQRAGDIGSQMMFARSQYEQNAKRKNVVIPKGTVFKNVKIGSGYDNKNASMYLFTSVKDEKRGAYDEAGRRFNESDFKVTNLSKEGNNFFNVKNFLVIKNNGFDISENAIVDIQLNKDITVSIFDEPYIDPVFNNGGFPPVSTNNIPSARTDSAKNYIEGGTTVLCNNGKRDITYGVAAPCSGAGGVANNQNPNNKPKPNYTIIGILAIIGAYVAYKVFFNKKSE